MKSVLRILSFAALNLAVAASAAELAVTKENAAGFYRDFTRLTQRPHWVAPLTAVLCALPSRATEEREKQITGIHYRTSVHIYANPLAVQVIADRKPVFPVGAAIVKEKLADGGKVSGIGGMIKRSAGYDAANGDWEYFYYGGPNEFSSGRISSCIECHRSAKTKDYVYSVWSLPRQ